jgi:hypothetical protein
MKLIAVRTGIKIYFKNEKTSILLKVNRLALRSIPFIPISAAEQSIFL